LTNYIATRAGVEEIDVNPLLERPHGAVALDALIKRRGPVSRGAI